jgi:hypothetical protein
VANVTIAIDDDLLRAARVKAVQQGTSVNEVCRQAIEAFARSDETAQQLAQGLLGALDKARAEAARRASAKPKGEPWPGRDALYDDVMADRRLGPR